MATRGVTRVPAAPDCNITRSNCSIVLRSLMGTIRNSYLASRGGRSPSLVFIRETERGTERERKRETEKERDTETQSRGEERREEREEEEEGERVGPERTRRMCMCVCV